MKRLLENLTHPDEALRKQAIVRLGSSRDLRLMPLLMQIADRDPSIEVRFFAKKALAQLKESAQESHDRAAQSPDFPVAPTSQARSAVPSPPPPSGADPTAARPAAPAPLATPLQDADATVPRPTVASPVVPEGEDGVIAQRLAVEDPFQRIRVVQELVQLRHPGARRHLVKLLERETHPHVRATLAIAIGIVGGADDLPVLLGLLDDENPRIRANAIEGLGHLGNPAACRHLTPLVKDPDNRVRANALTALARFQRGDLLEGLGEMIDSPERADRDSAAYTLVKLELPEAVPLLARLLGDGEISIRLKARNGLVKLAKAGCPDAMRALCEWGGSRESPDAFLSMSVIERLPTPVGLDSDDAQERLRAIQKVIEFCDDSQGLALFRRLAVEENPKVKASLVVALGRLGIRDAFDTIRAFLDDEDPRIRANAVEALGTLDPIRAAPLVFPFLGATNNRLRANAVVALAACPHVNLVPTLNEMIESADSAAQASAIYAITELARARYAGLLIRLLRAPAASIRRKAVDALKILASQGIPTASRILTRWADDVNRA